MSHVACESKLCSVVRSSTHLYPENRVATRREVVYYALDAHALNAGITFRCGVNIRNPWNWITFDNAQARMFRILTRSK